MKGIVLAGGYGTRLYPLTLAVNKHLLPVYNKPMIYYPISVLMLAGIKDILIISSPDDLLLFKSLLWGGKKLGVNFSYAEQPEPKGIAEAFTIGRDFIGDDSVCLILGDNVFYGDALPSILKKATDKSHGATIFGYKVKDPERYGVAVFDTDERIIDIQEKPLNPVSNWAITGLYFYDNTVIDIANTMKPSMRGELEITDINMEYLAMGSLHAEQLGRGIIWLDTGTFDSLHEASSLIKAVENRQGLKVACLEEIAYKMGFIDRYQLKSLAINNEYGKYLRSILDAETTI